MSCSEAVPLRDHEDGAKIGLVVLSIPADDEAKAIVGELGYLPVNQFAVIAEVDPAFLV